MTLRVVPRHVGRRPRRLPFGEELQSQFTVVGRFLDGDGQPTVSRLPPERVAKLLQRALG